MDELGDYQGIISTWAGLRNLIDLLTGLILIIVLISRLLLLIITLAADSEQPSPREEAL